MAAHMNEIDIPSILEPSVVQIRSSLLIIRGSKFPKAGGRTTDGPSGDSL